jgi:hypothetical protein
MMTHVDMYNSLLTVEEASSHFTLRDAIFAKLAPLLSNYDHKFGVCLVHAHCTLHLGEKMVATGNISQPVDVTSSAISHYPERWLANGEPYEFTKEPTASPPPELFAEFNGIVGDVKVLGLYFIGEGPRELNLEWTEGRKNITKVISLDESKGCVETAWLPGTASPVQMACATWCYPEYGSHSSSHSGSSTN